MNTVLFVNATIGFSENLFIVYILVEVFRPDGVIIIKILSFKETLSKSI